MSVEFIPVRFVATGATGTVPEEKLAYYLGRGYVQITDEELENTPFPYVRSIGNLAGEITIEELLAAISDGVEGVSDVAIAALRAALVGGAPDLLNTLDELSAAIGDDPNYAATIATALGQRVTTAGLDAAVVALLNNPGSAVAVKDSASIAGAVVPSSQTAVRAKAGMALRSLTVALGVVATTPVDICFAGGDSWVNGVNAGKWDNTYPSQLLAMMRAAYQPDTVVGGKGFIPITNNVALADHPLTGITGTTFVSNDYGLALDTLVMFGGATATVAIPAGTTGWDIVSTNVAAFSGVFNYTLDGVAGTPVNTSLGANESGMLQQGIRGLDPKVPHSLVITAVDPIVLDGFVHYNGDEAAGARVWNGGHSAYSLKNFLDKPNWETALKRIQPKVIVGPSGNNDAFQGRTPTQYAADLVNYLARVRAVVTVPPVIVLPIYPDLNMSTSGFPASDYAAVQRAAAAADSMVVVADMSLPFGPWANDTRGGLMGADKVHPSGRGAYGLAAQAIWDALALRTARYFAGLSAAAQAANIATVARMLLPDGITYNGDGTIATSTTGGITTTYTWNTDGTIATEARDGKTKTYTYASGVLTGSTVA